MEKMIPRKFADTSLRKTALQKALGSMRWGEVKRYYFPGNVKKTEPRNHVTIYRLKKLLCKSAIGSVGQINMRKFAV